MRGGHRSQWLVVGAVFVIALSLSGCVSGGSASSVASPSAAPTSSATSKAFEKKVNACDNKPWASGDIYVRMISPGVSAQAQELGGEWRWDYANNKCLNSVDLEIATAPKSPGNCTQVGYVDDNPGYDPNATPAKPMKNVVAQVGPAC